MKHTFFSGLSIAAFLALGAFSTALAATSTQPIAIGMPNPASVFCKDSGGNSIIKKQTDGSEYGVCKLPDNREVEEWDMYRKSLFDFGSIVDIPKNGFPLIQAKYPIYRDAAFKKFNQVIAFYIKNGIQEVRASANIPGSVASQSVSYNSSFQSYSSSNTVSAVVSTEMYLGGAHGVEDIHVFLSRKDGKALTFKKYLFGNAQSLQTFAFQTQLELLKKYPNLGKKAVVDATDAKWSNFTRVAIDGDDAIVYFNTYELGTRPDGAQSVRVSLKGLRTLDIWD